MPGTGRKVPMLNEVYNARILELAGNIPRLGRLDAPDASATAHSKLCGSTVTVDLKMDGPVVTDFAHDVKACALGQASSSIMARHVIGAKAAELRTLARHRAQDAQGERPAAGRQVGRYRGARAGARLQGAPRLDHAHLRCGGLGDRPDRGKAQRDDRGYKLFRDGEAAVLLPTDSARSPIGLRAAGSEPRQVLLRAGVAEADAGRAELGAPGGRSAANDCRPRRSSRSSTPAPSRWQMWSSSSVCRLNCDDDTFSVAGSAAGGT